MSRRVPTAIQLLKRYRWIDGTPLWPRIEEYRRRIFAEALDALDAQGRPRHNLVVCGRAKKNAKSLDLILAGIDRLIRGVSPWGNQVFLLANDEDQAGDDLELAVKLIRANPPIEAAVTIGAKEITRKDGKGYMLILPAKDIAGSHGGTYRFCGFDEIHEYKDWALLEALQLDPTRPDSLMWITSYASLNHRPGVPLYDLMAKGKTGTDPRMLFSWYGGDFTTDPAYQDASPEDRANPSRGSWEDPDYLDQQRRRLPTVRFRRLHLNLPGFPDGGAFDATKLDAAVERGARVRPPRPGVQYAGFVDMSGGSSDSCALAIGHREGGRLVVDCIVDQGQRPPFNPREAIPRFAAILREYRVFAVTGDTYGKGDKEGKASLGFEAVFTACGVTVRRSPLNKAELYEQMEVPLNAGELVLPDDPETLEQLAGLQRRGLKIEKRSGEHDDRANAVAGVTWLLGRGAYVPRPDLIHASGDRRSTISSPAERSLLWSSTGMPNPFHVSDGEGASMFDLWDRGALPGGSNYRGRG